MRKHDILSFIVNNQEFGGIGSRMEMKYSSGSREALNWRSWWTRIVIGNLLSSTPSLSCLMVVASVQSRLLMRSLSLSQHCNTWQWNWNITCSVFGIFTARDGGRRWDWCHVAPNWWCLNCVMNNQCFIGVPTFYSHTLHRWF